MMRTKKRACFVCAALSWLLMAAACQNSEALQEELGNEVVLYVVPGVSDVPGYCALDFSVQNNSPELLIAVSLRLDVQLPLGSSKILQYTTQDWSDLLGGLVVVPGGQEQGRVDFGLSELVVLGGVVGYAGLSGGILYEIAQVFECQVALGVE